MRIYNQIIESRYSKIFKIFNDYTMIPKPIYIANLELSQKYAKVKGDVVECGTWKGGMIAGISYVLKNDNKDYILFDSFEGLPTVKEIDGVKAKKWQNDVDSKDYFNNCTASVKDATNAMRLSNTRNFSIIKGWFNETLHSSTFPKGIAILRMDADWYDSTMEILAHLFDQVNKGGVIIIDDYYVWEGCSKAVHDYLSLNKRTETIRTYKNVCFIIKE